MDIYITALSIGLVGSLHCIGMCGPIALALPLPQKSFGIRLIGSLSYNLGRIVTYALLGALFGVFGKGLAMVGFQQVTSIVLGSVMILSVIFPVIFREFDFLGKISQKSTGILSRTLGPLFRKKNIGSLLLIGLLNGLLPCGLVYVAIAGAINTAGVVEGSLFMAFFGLGTFASMLIIPLVKTLLSIELRKTLTRIIPVFVVILGILFVLRGMNLGVKYISPKFNKEEAKVEKCCH